MTPQERGVLGASVRAKSTIQEHRKETGRRGGLTAGINKRLKKGIAPTEEELAFLAVPIKLVVPDIDKREAGPTVRPKCFSVFVNPRAPGSVDDGRACLCWRREGEWLGRHNCEGCARLDRARSLGMLNGARK